MKTAHIVDDSSVFVPAGWDSEKKLDLEKESIKNPDAPVTINEESILSARKQPDECEDEQTFLAQVAKILSEHPVSPKREPSAPAPQAAAPNRQENTTLANYFGSLINQRKAE